MINNTKELDWLVTHLDALPANTTHVGIDCDGEVRFCLEGNRTSEADFYPDELPPEDVRKEDECIPDSYDISRDPFAQVVEAITGVKIVPNMITAAEFNDAKSKMGVTGN